jgi:hypothetical protein
MVGQRNERPFFSRQPNNATQLSPALAIDDYLSSPGYNKPEPEEHDTAPHSHEWRAERDDEHEPLDMAFVLETVTLLPGSRRRSKYAATTTTALRACSIQGARGVPTLIRAVVLNPLVINVPDRTSPFHIVWQIKITKSFCWCAT